MRRIALLAASVAAGAALLLLLVLPPASPLPASEQVSVMRASGGQSDSPSEAVLQVRKDGVDSALHRPRR